MRQHDIVGHILWSRLPTSLANAWKILAYRTTIRLGKDCTFSLIEITAVMMYFTIIWIWCLINTTDETTGERFNAKYMGNRAAAIACTQFSLVVALGMRNNIIAALTGISFEKLNYLHRMFARILVTILWLHAGCRISLGLTERTALYNSYMICALLAITPFTTMCLVFWSPIRRRMYEPFYLLHFLTVFLLLVGAYFHAQHFNLGYYLLPALGLWAFDRVLRVARIFTYNYAYFGLVSGVGTFNATAELVTENVVRLRFRRPSHLHWAPGQNAWLTMPSVSKFVLESHPFTIATVDVPRTEDLTEKRDTQPSLTEGKEVAFIIQARTGFTRRLAQVASMSGSLKIFFDGPYSSPPRLAHYDTVVLLAGGTGISFVNPLFIDLLYRTRKDPSYCRSVIFVWCIRDPDLVNAIYEELSRALRGAPPTLRISVRIHVTRGREPTLALTDSEDRASSTGTEKESVKDAISRIPHTEFLLGRPAVQDILEGAISSVQGPVAVVVCGPSSLSGEVKRVLRSPFAGPMNVLKGGPNVDLFVETFGA